MDAEMSKRVLDEFLKKTEDGFIVVDKEGIIREINENYCDFLARGRDEIIGRPINEVISTTSMLFLRKDMPETAIMSMCILINRGKQGMMRKFMQQPIGFVFLMIRISCWGQRHI